jgi:glutamate-ammonia-ligase adenylyltransferase
MVASLASFRKYQREQAWTWEHQALLRSRPVAGDPGLQEVFAVERRTVLIDHVDRDGLGVEVAKMRARMRRELSASRSGEFDIKQDAGGLADIEFLIDYRVLADAPRVPALVDYPDNVRQLEALAAAALLPPEDCERIKRIYIAYRSRLHELALADGGTVVPDSEFEAERALISAYWQAALGPAEATIAAGGGA